MMQQNELPHNHGQAMEHNPQAMPSLSAFQSAAEVFKQLGDGNRMRIFWLLCHCEECVINISSLVDMSSPAVSHHLRQLRAAGVNLHSLAIIDSAEPGHIVFRDDD